MKKILFPLLITTVFVLLITNKAYAACDFGSSITGGQCRGYITTLGASTWTVPADWSGTNKIEVIGAGSAAAAGAQSGYGGSYASITNEAGLSGTVDAFVGGSQPAGVNAQASSTYLCSSTSGCTSITDTSVIVGAYGGLSPSTGAGTSGGIGTVTYIGGTNAGTSYNGAGGAAGPFGNGKNATTGYNGAAGCGDYDGTTCHGGAGGTSGSVPGGNGTEWDATHGSGGGGGPNGGATAVGGLYGGGGGNGANSLGGQGIIVITYTPAGGGGSTPAAAPMTFEWINDE